MDDSSFIRVNGSKVEVSEIFKWYADDFVKHSGSVEAYITTNTAVPHCRQDPQSVTTPMTGR